MKKLVGILVLTLLITTAVAPAIGMFNFKNIMINKILNEKSTTNPTSYMMDDWDYWSNPPNMYSIPYGNTGVGTDNSPVSKLSVQSQNNWAWNVGNGWGDFSIGDENYGLSIGVATSGGGAGDVRIWPQGGTERLIFGNPTLGSMMVLQKYGTLHYIGLGTLSPIHHLDILGGDAVIRDYHSGGGNTPEWSTYFGRGSESNPSVVQSGDVLGGFTSYGYNGNNYVSGGQIACYVDGAPLTNGYIPCFWKISTGSGSNSVVAKFDGRVSGREAVNDDEYVTKGQVESTINAYYTPTSTDDTNGDVGDFAWDDNYFYVKTNDGWKRAAFETWTSNSD
jgi:hypothetical protein